LATSDTPAPRHGTEKNVYAPSASAPAPADGAPGARPAPGASSAPAAATEMVPFSSQGAPPAPVTP